MKQKQQRFKRCVVVVNPASSNYDRGQKIIRELTDYFPDNQFETIEMRQSDYERPSWLITRLNAALTKKSLLVIAGGDGTDNIIIDTLLRSSAISPDARQSVVFPIWAGNANDLAHMANGNPPSSIGSIITDGSIVNVHPLLVQTKHGSNTTAKLAINYVSLGASAYASLRISDPAHRRRKRYRLPGARNFSDMASVTRAFIGAPTFESELNDMRRPIYDIAMINGSRIAKVNRIPVQLTDKNFYEILIARKHPLILSYIVQLIKGVRVERQTHTKRSLTIKETTWGQIDGEPVKIPGDTLITVTPFEKSFQLLATKLPT